MATLFNKTAILSNEIATIFNTIGDPFDEPGSFFGESWNLIERKENFPYETESTFIESATLKTPVSGDREDFRQVFNDFRYILINIR